MRKIIVIIVSLLTAFAIMSGGYGKWREELKIVTDIVVLPDPAIINSLIAQREQLILDAQRIEEERLLEEQKALEAQKLLEAEKLLQEKVEVEELEESQDMFNIEIEVLDPPPSVNYEIDDIQESDPAENETEEVIEDINDSEEPSLQEENTSEIIDSDNQE